MSPIIIIILFALAVVFLLLMILFIQRQRDSLFMAQHRHMVSGTVVDVKIVRTGNNVSDRVQFSYTVDGKEYTHVCYCRPDKYHRDQTVQIIYHPNKPKLASPEGLFRVMPKSDVRLMAFFLVLMYVFAVCLALSNVYDSWGRAFDRFEFPMILLFNWFSYWTEYRIVRKGKSSTGTIVYSERDHKTVRVIAEFDVNGVTYDTRMMNMPAKRCKREYNQGGQIGVLYREQNPVESVIEDDTLKERALRIFAIISSIVLPIVWIVVLFID